LDGLIGWMDGFILFSDYEKDLLYIGAIVGRVAGRISPPLISIDGRNYHLTANSEGVHLHGGLNGFDKVRR
jgi:aldose 1-epimerase